MEQNLEKHSKAIAGAMEEGRRRHDEKVKEWNSRAGARVRHPTYLLEGVLTGGCPLHLGNTARVCIKWDNGAESVEMPCNIVFEEE